MPDDSPTTHDVLWACVEEGFHVGSRAGDFLGYVDRQPDGAFRAFDSRSMPLGDFETLHLAAAAVGAVEPSESAEDIEGAMP